MALSVAAAVEGYEPVPVAQESGAEGGEGGRRTAAGGATSAYPLNREQCAQILKRALIIEDVNMCEVRQGRFR